MNNFPSGLGSGPHRGPSKEQFWRQTLAGHAASGQGVRAFCRERGLSEPSFYAWRRAIAQRDRKPAGWRVARQPRFVELRPEQSTPSHDGAPLEIVAGSNRLLIRAGCDRALLREVLAALTAVDSVEAEA